MAPSHWTDSYWFLMYSHVSAHAESFWMCCETRTAFKLWQKQYKEVVITNGNIVELTNYIVENNSIYSSDYELFDQKSIIFTSFR